MDIFVVGGARRGDDESDGGCGLLVIIGLGQFSTRAKPAHSPEPERNCHSRIFGTGPSPSSSQAVIVSQNVARR